MTGMELSLAVVMERRPLANPWADHQWEAVGVLPDRPDANPEGEMILSQGGHQQWIYPGRILSLFPDEAENYLLNVSAGEPRVFVMWRLHGSRAVPEIITVSYGEAARMMDSGEQVDGVPMPVDLLEWVTEFAHAHYRAPEKKSKRYATSKDKRTRP